MRLVEWNDLVDTAHGERPLFRRTGSVKRVTGLTIVSEGPVAALGELCDIVPGASGSPLLAEVVGFSPEGLVLMPLGEVGGIAPGDRVVARGHRLRVRVSERLLGHVVNGLGVPVDGFDALEGAYRDVDQNPPAPLERPRITECLQTGIRAIDGLLTCGGGQRMGIFAGSGVGKSTLLGMIARNTSADINVVALVGERGREVREFLERDLGEAGLARSVVVVATSDQPAMLRVKAALVATTIAEYFRDCGKNVLLMMDSVTRFAMAQREVGLAAGEPPTSRGYTPSVFAMLPRLMERAGTARVGSITAFYTVLVDGDDLTEPITDTTRSILDGHIVLSRSLANQGHFPSIDVLASISRLMSELADGSHKAAANKVRGWMSTYEENRDLIHVGAYRQGSDPTIDDAIRHRPAIKEFLCQGVYEEGPLDTTVAQVIELAEGAGE